MIFLPMISDEYLCGYLSFLLDHFEILCHFFYLYFRPYLGIPAHHLIAPHVPLYQKGCSILSFGHRLQKDSSVFPHLPISLNLLNVIELFLFYFGFEFRVQFASKPSLNYYGFLVISLIDIFILHIQNKIGFVEEVDVFELFCSVLIA